MKTILLLLSALGMTYMSNALQRPSSAVQVPYQVDKPVPKAIPWPFKSAPRSSMPAPVMPSKTASSAAVRFVSASASYHIRNDVVFKHWLVDEHLSGVLKGKARKLMEVAEANGLCPYFLTAVCMHESGNGKSKLSINNNNVCGIYRNGKYSTFDSVDECLEYMGKLLAGRIYAKCKTIGDVKKIYCPNNAANDPKNLNYQWTTGVVYYMNKISGNEIPVKTNII